MAVVLLGVLVEVDVSLVLELYSFNLFLPIKMDQFQALVLHIVIYI